MGITKFNSANATAFGSIKIVDRNGKELFSRQDFDKDRTGNLPVIRKDITNQTKDVYELLTRLRIFTGHKVKDSWFHTFTVDENNSFTDEIRNIVKIRLPEAANSEINRFNSNLNGQAYPGLVKVLRGLNFHNELEYKFEKQPVEAVPNIPRDSLVDMLGSR